MMKDRRVAEDTVNTSDGKLWISTVYVKYSDYPYYETMVFTKDENDAVNFSEIDVDRYDTKEEAIEGHLRMVARYTENRLASSFIEGEYTVKE